MKKISLLFVLAALGFIAWLVSQPEPTSDVQVSVPPAPDEKAVPVENVKTPRVEVRQKRELTTDTQSAFSLIASVYAAELTTPPYSRPLNKEDFDKLNPNHFSANTVPVDDNGGQISASLEKYRFSYPEPVQIWLDGEGIHSAKVQLFAVGSKTRLAQSVMKYDNGRWQVTLSGQQDFPMQLQANVLASVGNKTIPIALQFKYTQPAASLIQLGKPEAKGADMQVPATLEVFQPGLYRLRANLFTQNNTPVAQLTAKQKLDKGQQQVWFKAHSSVLQGTQAPYVLKTFVIERMSPAPGVPKQFGDSKIQEHPIEDFDVQGLDLSEYQPTDRELQRLEFLNQMAGGR